MSTPLAYGLGCPLWALADWEGGLYRAGSTSGDYLRQYASVFNAVEGNTTFYATPAANTVARWMDQVPEHFRFCFKFPRVVTHDARLRGCEAPARAFIDRLRPLRGQMGPLMIQLPASFGPASLKVLFDFLQGLPEDFSYAVELRQRRFFDDEILADEVDEQLQALGVERIVLDSRPMRSGDANHPDVLAAEHAKPNLPVRPLALTSTPIVRLIAHPDAAVTAPWLMHWARIIRDWLNAGRRPMMFMHCPNNAHSPTFARLFHQALVAVCDEHCRDVGALPAWPGEEAVLGGASAGQLSLL
ncbi:MAG: DUF72 domain-containing protein [Pseudomonadota bacterium]